MLENGIERLVDDLIGARTSQRSMSDRSPSSRDTSIFFRPRRHTETCLIWLVKILSWNCKEALNAFYIMVDKHSPHCVFLMKTKWSKDKLTRIFISLSFHNCEVVNAKGLVRMLVLMHVDKW